MPRLRAEQATEEPSLHLPAIPQGYMAKPLFQARPPL